MKISIASKTLFMTLLIAGAGARADEAGIGHHDTDPDSTPPETTTESCTSTLKCAWAELLQVFQLAE